ncbi:MAG: hypothetical protein WAU99_07070, partial [Pseudolabrys sp.]
DLSDCAEFASRGGPSEDVNDCPHSNFAHEGQPLLPMCGPVRQREFTFLLTTTSVRHKKRNERKPNLSK